MNIVYDGFKFSVLVEVEETRWFKITWAHTDQRDGTEQEDEDQENKEH